MVDTKPPKPVPSRPSLHAGLARIIDRERPSYQQLAEKVLHCIVVASAVVRGPRGRGFDARFLHSGQQLWGLTAYAYLPSEARRGLNS